MEDGPGELGAGAVCSEQELPREISELTRRETHWISLAEKSRRWERDSVGNLQEVEDREQHYCAHLHRKFVDKMRTRSKREFCLYGDVIVPGVVGSAGLSPFCEPFWTAHEVTVAL